MQELNAEYQAVIRLSGQLNVLMLAQSVCQCRYQGMGLAETTANKGQSVIVHTTSANSAMHFHFLCKRGTCLAPGECIAPALHASKDV